MNRRRRILNMAGGGGGAFTPTDIAGLALWNDASDTASITATANAVDQWNDKSGNARHTTATLSRRPTTNTRTINSLNVLDFDGTDDVMIGAAGTLAIPNGANTIFVVYASDNLGDATQNIMNGLNAGSGLRYALGNTATDFQCQNRTTSSIYTTQALVRSTSTVAAGFIRSGTSITPFVNGVKGAAGTNAEDITLTQLNIGAQTNTGTINRFNGMLAEIIWYNSALSDANCNLVGSYLTSKWAATWTGF